MQSPSELQATIIEAIYDKKGQKVQIIDLSDIESSPAPALIICQARSSAQVSAIADNVRDEVGRRLHIRPYATIEDKEESLEVIDANNKTATILSFIRHGKRKKDFLVVVMNLTTIEQQNFEIGVPYPGSYREVWNTEMEEFGGT